MAGDSFQQERIALAIRCLIARGCGVGEVCRPQREITLAVPVPPREVNAFNY